MTSTRPTASSRPAGRSVRSFTDPNTGREVRQLTQAAGGCMLGYFRMGRALTDGRVLAFGKHEHGNCFAIDAASGDVEPLALHLSQWGSKFYENTGDLYDFRSVEDVKPVAATAERTSGSQSSINGPGAIQVVHRKLPGTAERVIGQLPGDIPGFPCEITCDGRYVLFLEYEQDLSRFPLPTTMDLRTFWGFFSRPRRGAVWACDLKTGSVRKIYDTQGYCPLHLDCSPSDPGLLRFAHDMMDFYTQRTSTIRVDGSGLTPIHRQEFGELITHEFWWSDPGLIGYTYQDRRRSTTLHTHPWAEYSPEQTRLGLADLSGRCVYMSDPINCYHTHIYRSLCGRFVSGEGTHDHSAVYSARFDLKSTRLEMVRLATVRTAYVPFRGQHVEAGYSPDGKWMLYNDTVDGVHQVHCVANDI